MIVLISGTNRPDSNTRRITRLFETEYTALGVAHRVLDLGDLPVDLFLPESYATKPAAFQPFADAILAATGLHVVTPEYNGGVPGVLKYFIDHLKFPESFDRKPVCFTGLAAGMWGALRPVEQLQSIFAYRNAYLYPERVFIPAVGDALTETGQLRDADLAKRLRRQAQGFATFVTSIDSLATR
jgi:NAD(P)H-dependent FMN reductase